jgi:hypothetical protein
MRNVMYSLFFCFVLIACTDKEAKPQNTASFKVTVKYVSGQAELPDAGASVFVYLNVGSLGSATRFDGKEDLIDGSKVVKADLRATCNNDGVAVLEGIPLGTHTIVALSKNLSGKFLTAAKVEVTEAVVKEHFFYIRR